MIPSLGASQNHFVEKSKKMIGETSEKKEIGESKKIKEREEEKRSYVDVAKNGKRVKFTEGA